QKREAFQEKGAVLIIQKDRAAFVAANDDMLEQAGKIEARGSRHGVKVSEMGAMING
ncbi:MAG: hypothetical protein PWP34_1521, partial [Desulfuromonadales bacterium]|nr:hypothetical protein [Desulfuromonadales bacterium]